jgi:hypothetical protein
MSAESLLICCWSVPVVLLVLIAGVARLREFTVGEFCNYGLAPSLALGGVACWTVFYCLIGWRWWWAALATLAALPVTPWIAGTFLGCIAVIFQLSPDDDGGSSSSASSSAGSSEPPRAGVALDARAKKLFVQLDDPASGQRVNALELLRAHLAKNNRTFRDLLHEFEGRSNG